MQRRILIVDDNEQQRTALQQLLEVDFKVKVDPVSDGSEALKALGQHSYSIVISDLRMPRLDGLQLMEAVQKERIPVTVILMTAHGSIDGAVQAMRMAPTTSSPSRSICSTCGWWYSGRCANASCSMRSRACEQLQDRYSFKNIISKNPRMHAMFELISNVAHTTTTVLIEGETGTGKEIVARAIHQASELRTGPMIAVNCAALPENLLESELFGHEKGSFTSAVGQRKGRLVMRCGILRA